MNHNIITPILTRHEAILQALIHTMDIQAPRIRDAILYSLFPGGKRMRPILVYLCGKLLQVDPQSLDIIAAAIELTHCYSLIHDDLPAMDNDDMRRGKPSCHRAFDEATAILAGDALQILAIDVLLTELPRTLSPHQVIIITQELIKASGPAGMISGQSLDLSELNKPNLSESRLCDIHTLKTGRLIAACFNMVIAASETSVDTAETLRQFANHLGLVFQMQDDYLDKYDNKSLGKGQSSDTNNQKTTFATLYDKQTLAHLIAQQYQEAQKKLTALGPNTEELVALLDDLNQRTSLSI